MRRNLVLIHLESLNNFVYKMNPSFFPFLRKIERESLFFDKYFSTATSTLMTLGDIYYGGLEQYEECDSLAHIPLTYHYQSSLFDDLKKRGYRTGLFVYPDGNDRDTAEERHIAGFQNEMVLKADFDDYLSAIEDVAGEEPFALALCNYISNLAYNKYTDIYGNKTGRERWEAGFKALDRSVKDVFDILKKKGVLHNTIILLYGDHGDDYWIHKAQGRTHPVEPYTHLIHTPLMIYDERFAADCTSQLVCASDIRFIAEKLLQNDNATNFLPHRDTVVSRIMYAAQPVYTIAMRKSYSITDGKLLLLVSDKGFEMYDVEMDPLCTNNLLVIFVYEEDILFLDTEHRKKIKYQYDTLMNSSQVRYIRQRFYYLRERLYNEVKKLYRAGKRSEEEMLGEMEFAKIRYIDNLFEDE